MDGYSVYKIYIASKLHFTTDYDVFKKNGAIKGYKEKYNVRNDKSLFEKLGRKFKKPSDAVEYFVSNFAVGHDAVVYHSSVADDLYKDWIKTKESITHVFKEDCNTILNSLTTKSNNLYSFSGSTMQIPELMKLHIGNHIKVQTIVILNAFNSFFDNWKTQTNIIFADECRRIIKAERFVKFDRKKVEDVYNKFVIDMKKNVDLL
jgi:hypothetical protein